MSETMKGYGEAMFPQERSGEPYPGELEAKEEIRRLKSDRNRLAIQLDAMANRATHFDRPLAEIIGGLQYMIWEARQTLGMPDYPGLTPV